MKCNSIALGVTICVLLICCSTKEGAPATRQSQNASPGESRQAPGQPAAPQQAVGASKAVKQGEAVSADQPKDLLIQWARFQTALKTDDTALLADVTHFPLECNEFGGEIKSADVLKQRYATIFPDKTKHCLLTSTLHREEADGKVFYEVYCDVGPYPIRFLFNQVGSRFFLTCIDNINE